MPSFSTFRLISLFVLVSLTGIVQAQHVEIQPAGSGELRLHNHFGDTTIRLLPGGGIRLQARAGNVTTLMGADGVHGMYISPGGKVGIRHASPSTDLQIGDFQHFFSETVAAVNRYAVFSNNLKYNGSGGFDYVNNGAGLAVILGDDNGTPKMQFSLYGNGLAGNTTTATENKMNLTADGLAIGRDNANAALHIVPQTTAALRIDQVDGSGEVPELQMEGGTDNEFLTFRPNAAMTTGYILTFPPTPGGANNFLRTDGAGNLSWVAGGGNDNLGNHTAAQNLNLATYKLVGNGGTQGISIANNGDVMIGSSSTGDRLMVHTTSNNDGISIDNSAGNISFLRFWENGSSVRGALTVYNNNFDGMDISSQKLSFSTGTLNTERMLITSSGSVGVGTSPATGSKLHVLGNTLLEGNVALRPDGTTVTISYDNFTLDPLHAYIRLVGNAGGSSNSTITLGTGTHVGQILVLEGTSDAFSVEVADDAANNNTNTVSTRILKQNDIISLIWNGTDWLEVSFSDN